MSAQSQSTASADLPIWRQGLWWFIGSEIVVFGGFLASYILTRFRHPEWAHEAAHTLSSIGAINTVILLTSSLTMILAHHKVMEENDLSGGRKMLGITILLGFVFLGLKSYEYTHEIQHGLVPSKSLFWSYYYMMTGLHGLHILVGQIANIVVFGNLGKGFRVHRIESVGIYWHFVDLVWIFLFPLLYLASSGGTHS